jgi:hypothetical protein
VAKAEADAFCADACGSDAFTMVDFDMNQWMYSCYTTFVPGVGPRAYHWATWGGSLCAKTVENGLIETCNPPTHMITVRQNLNEDATVCPECDEDEDSFITLVDLIMARNDAFRKEQALGMTFPMIYDSQEEIENAVGIDKTDSSPIEVTFLEITKWTDTEDVDCENPGQDLIYLPLLTDSDEDASHLMGQSMANAYCVAKHGMGFVCDTGAIGFSLGHCQVINGVDTIRAVAGYCNKCTNSQ